jgi:hypothetical protein
MDPRLGAVDVSAKVTWHDSRAIGIKIRDMASAACLCGRRHGANETDAKLCAGFIGTKHDTKIPFKLPALFLPEASSFSFSFLSGFLSHNFSLPHESAFLTMET